MSLRRLTTPVSVFWFRRDLRLNDNKGLSQALRSPHPILPLFIFDRSILDALESRSDRRVQFIHEAVIKLHHDLRALGSGLMVVHGRPDEVFKQLLEQYSVAAIYANEDYEPYAIERDAQVASQAGVPLHLHKDQVIFAKREVVKDDGSPYTVFTPYSRKWKAALKSQPEALGHSKVSLSGRLVKVDQDPPSLEDLGFHRSPFEVPQAHPPSLRLLKHYATERDLPAASATSRLGVHLRFGTVSIRELVKLALKHSETWLNELIWREFFMMILFHFPHTVNHAFRPAYDRIQWRNDRREFKLWCEGRTGYPLVDAGMRELLATGFMHNRVRMVTASFLCKHLLIDWRWGERYFASHLLDFELSSNVGNWQWAAGTGCDAAPYFRVFNPTTQADKFDSRGEYIRRWVKEGESKPMVEHTIARERALAVYRAALQENDDGGVHP